MACLARTPACRVGSEVDLAEPVRVGSSRQEGSEGKEASRVPALGTQGQGYNCAYLLGPQSQVANAHSACLSRIP
jgi:hypothetical protein